MTTRAQQLEALWAIAEKNHISLLDDGVIPSHVGAENYIHPDRGNILFITNLVLATITVLVVAARIYTRWCVVGGIGGDDVSIGVAMVVVIASTALNSYGVKHAGIGKHFYDISVAQTSRLLKTTYAMPLIYSVGVCAVKVSILLYYRRLFGKNRMLQKVVLYFLIFQLVLAFASILAFSLICSPPKAWWHLEMRVEHCPTFQETMRLYVGLRLVTVLCDIGVLCLPVHVVWRLQLPKRQRIGLAALFTLGFSACAVAVARLSLLPRVLTTLDVSWHILPIALLDQVEQCLGIITASIPALTGLVYRHRRLSRHPYVDTELSDTGVRKGSLTSPGQYRDDFDFLSFAYDPDRNNLGTFCVAYSTNGLRNGPAKLEKRREMGREEEDDERLVGSVLKTTTVTVHVS